MNLYRIFLTSPRMNRLSYFFNKVILVIPLFVSSLLIFASDAAGGYGPVVITIGILMLLWLLIRSIMITIGRLHDFNWSGFWLIPMIIGSPLILILKSGDAEANQYGPPPAPASLALKLTGTITIIFIILIAMANSMKNINMQSTEGLKEASRGLRFANPGVSQAT